MILTYEYYRDIYGGLLVSEEQFPKYNNRAQSVFMNYINHDRLDSVLNSFMKDSVYIALGELIDNFHKFDEIQSKSHQSDLIGLSGIDSETTKDHTVKFKSSDKSNSKALAEDFDTSNINIIRKHLSTTGLLYRGL